MTTLHSLAESKICEACRAVFSRHRNERLSDWNRRRFCSVLCRNRKNTQFRPRDFCSKGHRYKIGGKRKYCLICRNEREKLKYRERHPPPITAYDPETQTKLCSGCGARKSITEFRKRGARDRIHRPIDMWQALCIACGLQHYRCWYDENIEHKLEYSRNRYEQNIDAIRQYDAERWLNGKKERTREVIAANRERYNSYGHAHRARKRNAPGTHFNARDVERIKEAQRGRCAICREKLRKYHVDHIKALARGGTNEAKNIQLLCATCNVRKNQTDQIKFMQRQGFLL